MRSGDFNKVFAIVVCVWTLVGVVAAQGDANTPLDPADYFEPYWSSVTLDSRLYNPAEEPDRDPNAQTALTISGGVRIVEDTGLVGIDDRERKIVVFNQDGVEIYASTDLPLISRTYQTIAQATRSTALMGRNNELWFTLSSPIAPEADYPSALSRVEWSMNVLMANEFMTVDVPFEPNEAWIELVPGLEILVEEASVDEGRYSYWIQAIYDPNLASFSTTGRGHFWQDEVPPAAMMTAMDILNAEGEPAYQPGTSGGFISNASGQPPLDGLKTLVATGTGRCSTCGDAATLRFTFALAPYEREARLALENIPVPGY